VDHGRGLAHVVDCFAFDRCTICRDLV
jgi:hypothetical protein